MDISDLNISQVFNQDCTKKTTMWLFSRMMKSYRFKFKSLIKWSLGTILILSVL